MTDSQPSATSSSSSLPRVGEDPRFDRPVFIVSSPRSGSTLLFETLARAPGLFTIGGESHKVIEGLAPLNVTERGFDSNRLEAIDASPTITVALRQRFDSALIDRDGIKPGPGRIRMLEKTPKNSLRIPFLARVFPEARFVYLYRDPRQVLGSMIEAWNSGRFRTYTGLPGWPRPFWALLLTPGWRELAGKSLADIVAAQWETTTRILLDDLEQLPRERWHALNYEALIGNPKTEIDRLCTAFDLGWDRPLDGALPLARHTLTKPDPNKWRRHAADIEPRLPRMQATIERAARIASM